MTTAHKFTVAAAIALAIALAVVGRIWLTEHDARKDAEAQTKLQQQSLDALKQQQANTDAQVQTKVAAIEKQKATPATAQQVVTDAAPDLGVPLPEALKVETSPADPNLPNAPAAQQVVIPEADFKVIRDAELSCQENSAKLLACASDKQNLTQQVTLTAQQRDEWEKTAKGGSLLHRIWHDTKLVLIGAGVGAGGVAIAYEINHQTAGQPITLAPLAQKARR